MLVRGCAAGEPVSAGGTRGRRAWGSGGWVWRWRGVGWGRRPRRTLKPLPSPAAPPVPPPPAAAAPALRAAFCRRRKVISPCIRPCRPAIDCFAAAPARVRPSGEPPPACRKSAPRRSRIRRSPARRTPSPSPLARAGAAVPRGLEYLAWWTKHQDLPILVTSGPFTDPVPGALGQPNTQTLVAGEIDDTFHSGGRLSLGWDLDDDQAWMAEISGFFLGMRNTQTTVSSDGGPNTLVIARPFFNANTNAAGRRSGGRARTSCRGASPSSSRRMSTAPTSAVHMELLVARNAWPPRRYLVGRRQVSGWTSGCSSASPCKTFPAWVPPATATSSTSTSAPSTASTAARSGLEYVWTVGPLSLTGAGQGGARRQPWKPWASAAPRRSSTATGNVTTAADRALLVQPSNAGTFHHQRASPSRRKSNLTRPTTSRRTSAIRRRLRLPLPDQRPAAGQPDRSDHRTSRRLQPFDQIGPARPGGPAEPVARSGRRA